jgi:Ca2+/Na+ antiporter
MQRILIFWTLAWIIVFFVSFELDVEFWQHLSLVLSIIGIFLVVLGEVWVKIKSRRFPE